MAVQKEKGGSLRLPPSVLFRLVGIKDQLPSPAGVRDPAGADGTAHLHRRSGTNPILRHEIQIFPQLILIPEDHSFTINGKEPVSDPVISYEDGVSTVSAVFEFTVGEPDEVKVSFDSNGRGDTPEVITVQKGKALELVDQPEYIDEITEGDKTWVFGGWTDEDGTPWEDIIADDDITLYAKWLPVIDNVQVTFDIPSLGDDGPELKVPDDAPYYLVYTDDEFDYHNTYISYDWEPVTSIDQEGSYDIFGYVSVTDGVFKLIQPDEEDPDYWEYGGILTVNGEECYASYEYGKYRYDSVFAVLPVF